MFIARTFFIMFFVAIFGAGPVSKVARETSNRLLQSNNGIEEGDGDV